MNYEMKRGKLILPSSRLSCLFRDSIYFYSSLFISFSNLFINTWTDPFHVARLREEKEKDETVEKKHDAMRK